MKKIGTKKENNNAEVIVLLLIIFLMFVGLVLMYEHKIDELEKQIEYLEVTCNNENN